MISEIRRWFTRDRGRNATGTAPADQLGRVPSGVGMLWQSRCGQLAVLQPSPEHGEHVAAIVQVSTVGVPEPLFIEVLHSDVNRLMQNTAEYLRLKQSGSLRDWGGA